MSFINAIIDAQERNLCLERLKAELAETPYFQKTDKALTACIASQLLKKYERAVKANGSPLLLNEAMYAVMTMLTFQNSWKKSVELLSMSDCDYLTAIIDKASESFDASLENFKDSLFRVAHGHIYLDRDVDDDEVKQFICEYGWDEETLDSPEFPGLLAEAVLESSATEYDTDGTYSTFEDAAKALGELIGVDVSQYL